MRPCPKMIFFERVELGVPGGIYPQNGLDLSVEVPGRIRT
jgi:hypothetical protein